MNKDDIRLYDDKPVRAVWDEQNEEWWFSVVDVISILTEQENKTIARKYWNKLKQRLKEEGSELVTNCHQLKMVAEDGKKRLSDVMTTEQLLRLIQSVPSKKAEPFKLWLAKVGRERIEETIDPELAIDRAFETYSKKGYSEEWIRQRLMSIKIRNELTSEWSERGVKKGIGYEVARRGGKVAGNARKEIEPETGEPVVSSENYKKLLGDSRDNKTMEIVKDETLPDNMKLVPKRN